MPVNPKILTIPFARDAAPGLVADIPDDPSGSNPQRASWKQGFPSITMIPLAAGGIPPQGQDFNGAIRDITEHVVYRNAGGQYKYSSTIVAELGGYSQGAVIESDDGLSLWVSLEDDNTENFNTEPNPTKWRNITSAAGTSIDNTVNGLDATDVQGAVDEIVTEDVVFDGVKTFSSSPVVPTPSSANHAANKGYVDSLPSYQPSQTGAATLTGIDNVIVMSGIAVSLQLEIGDVIQITGSADGLNDKLFTVETITDDNSIIVNYEHAGNRGNGSLKLADETATVTIKRIAKWYNAPIGLGQAWVTENPRRSFGTTYTNTTGRTIVASIYASDSGNESAQFYIDGLFIFSVNVRQQGGSLPIISCPATLIIPNGSTYRVTGGASQEIINWSELR